MKRLALTLLIIIIALAANVAAQDIKHPPTPSDETDVVKITSKLVQFDAVVTDKNGNPKTDLKREDFEILEDGKSQQITGFTYVDTDPSSLGTQSTDSRAQKPNSGPVPTGAALSNRGRIITFIVDDGNCAASQSGMVFTREALEKFINERMLPTDRVAIYQTRAGSSMLQQYSSDKTLLLRAARKIRWYPPTGGCAPTDGSFFAAAASNDSPTVPPAGTTPVDAKKNAQSIEDFATNNQVVGTIGVLRYAVTGLQRTTGRKIVFFLSDGIPFRTRDGRLASAIDVLRDLTDLANRSSVVFNTIDVRGLQNPAMIEAGDVVSTSGENDFNATDRITADRTRQAQNAQEGMAVLADETGGKFYHGLNSIDAMVGRALSREKGYYLLAYEPDDDTFKGKNFNKIEVRVRQSGLRVSARSGFLGVATATTRPAKKSENSELYDAIAAPLPEAGLNLQLTSYFGNSVEIGNFVRSLVHLQGDQISFVDDGNLKKAVLEVVAVTLNEKNEVVDEFTRTHTFKIEPAAIPLIKQNGIIYSTDVPIKKSGTYNLRVAVRDNISRLIGTASQVVNVPELKKRNLFLSGLILSLVDQDGKFTTPGPTKPETALSLIPSTAVPGIRQFNRGDVLAYAYTVYNAKLDPTANSPKLTVQMNLYRDGNLISEGKPQPADLEKQSDWSRITDYGYLRLNDTIPAGDYAVQIIVTDTLVEGKKAISSQWTDFEVQ